MNQNNDQQEQQVQQQCAQTLAMQPFALWRTSFDYVFGFQLKLMQDYWGMRSDRHRWGLDGQP